jgi:hypothetical protein
MAYPRIHRVLGAVTLCVALGTAHTAGAATAEEKAGARAAAMEGVKAYKDGRWQDALDMFSRAEGLVHSPVHMLYIARANSKLGHLVIAQETYMAAYREYLDPSAPPAFQRAKEQAQIELRELEPRLPSFTLKISGAPVEKVNLTMDGKKVPPLLIGVPRPIDPGSHEFKVSGPGVKPASLSVSIKESERKSATMQVEYDEAAAAAAVAAGEAPAEGEPAEGEPAGSGGAPDGRDEAPAEEGTNGLRLASYGALGVGAVGIGLGVVFGLNAKSKQDEANSLCDAQGCPLSQQDKIDTLDSDASSANTISIVGFVAGGVGLAAGATLFILSSMGDDSEEAAQGPSVTPFVGIGSAGVTGRF